MEEADKFNLASDGLIKFISSLQGCESILSKGKIYLLSIKDILLKLLDNKFEDFYQKIES